MADKVIVNPVEIDGVRLKVHDELQRLIPFRKGGTSINKTTHISRLIKAGDLEILGKEKEKPKEESKEEKPKTTPKKTGGKKTTEE